MELIIYLLIGAIAGFTAGLFGVGGGLIIVPILYIVFTQMNYDPNVIMHVAVGTSLATIIVTSISSVMAHHKKGAVLWQVFRNLAPGLVLGSFMGAGIADLMSGQHLQLVIGDAKGGGYFSSLWPSNRCGWGLRFYVVWCQRAD